jgi:predicted transcriptional regulator
MENQIQSSGSDSTNSGILSNYFKVPNDLFSRGLSSKAILVYCCLLRHAGNKMCCFPSRRRIATECSIGVSTVDRAMAELLRAGFVWKMHRIHDSGGQTSSMYYLNDPNDVSASQ